MADRSNQHFVPQYYFRHFSTNDRMIGTLLARCGTLIPQAPIKGQCARRNFYGSKEIEGMFSQLESRHCMAIRVALDIAWNPDAPFFSPEELAWLFEAVVFQRGRTALEIEKTSPAHEKMMLEMFKHHLLHSSEIDNVDEVIRHIDMGNVRVTEDPHVTILRHVSVALESRLAITDMNLCLLRNRTDYPFVFSDAPVVFYNMYCKKVRNRGVLGLQCPGLLIFFPLNSWTCMFLFDGDKYQSSFNDALQYDVVLRSDVSQINALQLHHSLNAAYFGDPQHLEYVHDLWNSHRRCLTVPKSEFRVRSDFLVDGKPPAADLLHTFEPQLEFNLNLSFIDCTPVEQEEYVYVPRNRELHAELRELRKTPPRSE